MPPAGSMHLSTQDRLEPVQLILTYHFLGRTCSARPPGTAVRDLQMHWWGPCPHWAMFYPSLIYIPWFAPAWATISHRSSAPSFPIPTSRSNQRAVLIDDLLLFISLYLSWGLTPGLRSWLPSTPSFPHHPHGRGFNSCVQGPKIWLQWTSTAFACPASILLLFLERALQFSCEELLLSHFQSLPCRQCRLQRWLQRQIQDLGRANQHIHPHGPRGS